MKKPHLNHITHRKMSRIVTGCIASVVVLTAELSQAGDIGFVDFYQDDLNGFDSVHCSQGTAVSPDGMFAYSASFCDGAINVFARDKTTGRLTPLDALLADPSTGSGINPQDFMLMHPSGRYLYTSGITGKVGSEPYPYMTGVFVYERDAVSGELSLVQSVERSGARPDWNGSMTKDGNYLYIGGQGGIDVFNIAGNGRLSEVQHVAGLSENSRLSDAREVTFTPDESLVFVVTNPDDRTVVWLSRDAITGELAYQGELTGGDGGADFTSVDALAVSRDGKYLYVSGNNSDNKRTLTHYLIGESGELSYAGVNDGVAINRAYPEHFYASPNNQILYFSGAGKFQSWGRDVDTGAVHFLGLSEDGEGGIPSKALSQIDQANISPDGKFAYVSVAGGLSLLDLAVDLSTSLNAKTEVAAGQKTEFELEILNTGETVAHNVVAQVVATGASEIEFASISDPKSDCEVVSPTQLDCSIPSLTVGGAEYAQLSITAGSDADALELEVTTKQAEIDADETKPPYYAKFDLVPAGEDPAPTPEKPSPKKKSGGSLPFLAIAMLLAIGRANSLGAQLTAKRASRRADGK